MPATGWLNNDVNATALMWAARDLEKTHLLIANGADVNAKSDDLRTPLMIAARRPGGAAVVKAASRQGRQSESERQSGNRVIAFAGSDYGGGRDDCRIACRARRGCERGWPDGSFHGCGGGMREMHRSDCGEGDG
jgi:hypothetical protein